jgi:hypothetical protein
VWTEQAVNQGASLTSISTLLEKHACLITQHGWQRALLHALVCGSVAAGLVAYIATLRKGGPTVAEKMQQLDRQIWVGPVCSFAVAAFKALCIEDDADTPLYSRPCIRRRQMQLAGERLELPGRPENNWKNYMRSGRYIVVLVKEFGQRGELLMNWCWKFFCVLVGPICC